jgi:hypothetical protein
MSLPMSLNRKMVGHWRELVEEGLVWVWQWHSLRKMDFFLFGTWIVDSSSMVTRMATVSSWIEGWKGSA